MTHIRELFDLRGRAAIVTGGGGLLGKEFCRTLAEAGAHVAVVDQQSSAAHDVADALSAAGHSATAVVADVSDPASVRAMVEATLRAYDRVDILVNSAALDPKFDAANKAPTHTASFEAFPLEVWSRALAVNLTGPYLTCQAVLEPMRKAGAGTIVNICSMYGLVGPDQRLYERPGHATPYKPAYYSVTKAGILGLTKYLATYLAGTKIRVNALTPGGVFNGHDEAFLQRYAVRSVLGRMAQPDEMNGALLYLASDASAYMTGANLVVDGGWTAW